MTYGLSISERLAHEDRCKLEAVNEILDVIDQAAAFRTLMREIADPGQDIVAEHRRMCLQIHEAIAGIARDVVNKDRSDRAYDEGLRG